MSTWDAVIIGAGSVGLPLSYELARRGWRVAVIERLPSPGRGQNRSAIGGLRATHSDPAKIGICRLSIDLVSRLEAEHGMDVDWLRGGYLYPVYEAEHERSLRSLLEVQHRYELDIDWIGPTEVSDRVPGIVSEGLRGGTWSPGDGSASPLKLALAYSTLARRAGVEFHFGEEVLGFDIDGGRIVRVRTDRGSFSAGVVIDASGAGARAIGAMAGLDVPVEPDCHEAGITEAVRRIFDPMVVDIRSDDESSNCYFYQNKEGQIVFCMTPHPKILGTDTDCTSEFLPVALRRLVALVPRLRNLKVRRTWRGLYPMTPDGFPIVGFAGQPSNLLLAAGMCGQGLMLGPGLAWILAETLVEGSDRHAAVFEQLSLHRDFGGQELLQ